MERPVTIRDIARRAGCSKSTVALALRDSPLCAAETRERVKRLAEAMGYRRNQALVGRMAYVSTRGRRGFTGPPLAYLTEGGPAPEMSADRPGHNGYEAARVRAEDLGSHLDFFTYNGSAAELKRMRRILLNRGIQGVILAPHCTPQVNLDLEWPEFAIVCVGFSLQSPRFDRVGFDHFEAMQDVCERAWDRGFRRLALAMTTDSDARVMHLARASFLRWQSDRPKFTSPALVFGPGQSDAVRRWYQRHRPDCIVYYGKVRFLRDAGLPIGRDVAVATPLFNEEQKEFGGFDIQLSHLSTACVDLVLARLFKNERGVPLMRQTLLIHSPWIEGPAAFRPEPG